MEEAGGKGMGKCDEEDPHWWETLEKAVLMKSGKVASVDTWMLAKQLIAPDQDEEG